MASSPGQPPPEWHDTRRPFRTDAVPAQLIAEAVARTPAAPALVGPDGDVLDYAATWSAATRVGRLLGELGTGAGDLVGVVGHHTAHTVVGILGVALAGAGYVPVDPDWPIRRQAQVLAAAGVVCLLAAGQDTAALPALRAGVPSLRDVVLLDVQEEEIPDGLHREEVAATWDSVVRSPDPLQAAGFNLDGGRQYSAAEVAAYADRVAALVLREQPAAVLEVGFGSGLVLRRVAPHVDFFAGVDPAPAAVASGQAWAEQEGLLVDLVVGFADELDALGPGPVDVAVLAATVQYFPDHGYLARVIDQLAAVVRPGGRLVIADLMAPTAAGPAGLLRVDPDDLRRLAGAGPWSVVEVLDRAGVPGLPEDLARRFDVVIRRGEDDPGRAAAPAGLRTWTGLHVGRRSADPLPVRSTADDVAYVIFTSGSTGEPKGVVVGNRSLVNLVQWVNDCFAVGPGDLLLQVTSFAFDLSVYDVFGILAAGAAIRLTGDAALKEAGRIARLLADEPVTFWNSAPAVLAWVLPFVPAATGEPGRDDLRRVFLSGDWVPLAMPAEIRQRFPRADHIVVLGGATEATVWSNYFVVGEVDPSWVSVPYGRPMQNARYYVLDDQLRQTPVGNPGNLYIAGDCVAFGYHADPGLTAGRFLPDTVAGEPGERMYVTGDLARWWPDGTLEFLGRVDHQVKVRGYRVELGEVEAAVAEHAGVLAAVAVAPEVGDARVLAAFYVARQPVDPQELRAGVGRRLPEYMVPARLWQLTELPRTVNGKVDRAALTGLASRQLGGRDRAP